MEFELVFAEARSGDAFDIAVAEAVEKAILLLADLFADFGESDGHGCGGRWWCGGGAEVCCGVLG